MSTEVKNNLKAIKEFAGKTGIVLRLSALESKPNAPRFIGTKPFVFAQNLIVIRTLHAYPEYVSVHFFPRTDSLNCQVDPELQVEEVKEGKEFEELKKAYDELIIKDLYKSLSHGFSVGSDPEIFVVDSKSELMPAFNFLPSIKDAPVARRDLKWTQNAYWDGFQAEFQTSAAGCLQEHLGSVANGLRIVLLEARKKDAKAKLSAQNIFEIPFKIMEESKDEHVNFGCMPSLNAYGLKGANIPAREVPFRPAGGHIHFGLKNYGYTNEQMVEAVKALDKVLGVACVSLFQKYDKPERRQLYGLPGEYRLPPHGLEYRTLSNAWLIHPTIANLVVDLSRKCVMVGINGYTKFWNATEEETLKCIINCDVKKAQEILTRNKAMFIQMYKACYGSLDSHSLDGIFNTYMKGLDCIVETPDDLDKNWNLSQNPKLQYPGSKEVRYVAGALAAEKKIA